MLRKQLGAPIRDVVGAGSAAGKAFGEGAVRRLAPERGVRQAKALGHASGFRALGRLREASVYTDGPPGAEDLSGKLAVMLGSWTEDFNRQWYEKLSGNRIVDAGRALTCAVAP